MSTRAPAGRPAGRTTLLVLATGLAAGLLAGLFGVGGGLVIVPALMSVLGMDQRRAAATSLAAIVVTAAVGTVSYAQRGQVSPAAFAIVCAGSLAGAPLGTWLLRSLPHRVLPWVFVGFTLVVIASQQLQAPVRETGLVLDPLRGTGLVAVGVVAGVLAGLVVVPGLQVVTGVGDLMARGTSLLVMIPTAAAGTWSNLRHGAVDLRAGLLVGAAAVVAAPLGTRAAAALSPAAGNALFNVFLVCVVLNVLATERARQRQQVRDALDDGPTGA
ncbi:MULTISPECIES: sulfite exporter TauE/SafE family protein [unclassified Actinomyces]|uniref:sulfite exporter TauE/SafE family protein n=1 Tax=unclassified Actinomyces TaxID=2609248 RepID=UPI002017E332|nr:MULTISPECIES: sulfite exporter TauE/SafE family protein [unclassified Actinomyces]MCL3778326.1 sulfite exporter TauE/SafE family protein [Actinomyces sp. AC-20-1]MCL3789219.1 sulfite exporter TauE/SafE family protein [Actinomyces sp. 187325]MCL3791406.1 sulfite exporter TauE/SafE family protein [Actinomyces sp. 186855]MCL3793569.1 sulfite exporter TauE/SafE family protein [Actinomyces sp. 217892]